MRLIVHPTGGSERCRAPEAGGIDGWTGES
jgi:hypothetical protein